MIAKLEQQGAVMTRKQAAEFAARWADSWNRGAVEEVLHHFHDNVVFTSPTATAVVGSPAVRGKHALHDYWAAALERSGKLHFKVDRVIWDAETRELAIIYIADISGRVRRVSENLRFDEDGLVWAGEVFHGVAG
jgi:ketosteroid isomerase-like protein